MLLLTTDILSQVIAPRPLLSHKGNFGRVLAIGGSLNFGGAIIMASQAAAYSGAGLVSCATNRANLSALHARCPEVMFLDYHDQKQTLSAIQQNDVIIIGPGLDLDDFGFELLSLVLTYAKEDCPVIIDGSAITLLSQHPFLLKKVKDKNVIFTPHQMEWQRLAQIPINQQEQATNLIARQKLEATVVLKKFQTEIYHQNNQIHQLSIGGPYMATGGMGDTLTGILAAFLAQFHNQDSIAVIDAAVYFHSYVARELSQDNYVTLPSAICQTIPTIMRRFTN